MQKHFNAAFTEQRIITARQDSLSSMADLVELITTARYGMPEKKMGYETDPSDGQIQMSFGPADKDYKTLGDLKEGDPVFYNSLRSFLSDLEDVVLDPSFVVDRENLVMAARTKMVMFDALKTLIEDERLHLSTMDNAVLLKTPEEQNWSSADVCSHIQTLADDCDVLKDKYDETFEYLLVNAPARPYLSLEHFKACMASRVEVDITMSLESVKQQILLEECSADEAASNMVKRNELVINLAKRGIYYN